MKIKIVSLIQTNTCFCFCFSFATGCLTVGVLFSSSVSFIASYPFKDLSLTLSGLFFQVFRQSESRFGIPPYYIKVNVYYIIRCIYICIAKWTIKKAYVDSRFRTRDSNSGRGFN